jgi:hypothetical protein
MLLPHATWRTSEGHFVCALQACVHYFSAYPRISGVTERCRQTLGMSSTYQNKKTAISTRVQKHLICELWLKEHIYNKCSKCPSMRSTGQSAEHFFVSSAFSTVEACFCRDGVISQKWTARWCAREWWAWDESEQRLMHVHVSSFNYSKYLVVVVTNTIQECWTRVIFY